MTHESLLRDAMIEFRQHHAPRVITEPCIHYNYASLQHAYVIFDQEWDNLLRASGNNYNKIRLVGRQLIAFQLRRLPGVDRCKTAQGLFNDGERTYKYMHCSGDFPCTPSDEKLTGLGFDFSIDIYTGTVRMGSLGNGQSWHALWKSYIKQKHQTYSAYTALIVPAEPMRRPGVALSS